MGSAVTVNYSPPGSLSWGDLSGDKNTGSLPPRESTPGVKPRSPVTAMDFFHLSCLQGLSKGAILAVNNTENVQYHFIY